MWLGHFCVDVFASVGQGEGSFCAGQFESDKIDKSKAPAAGGGGGGQRTSAL